CSLKRRQRRCEFSNSSAFCSVSIWRSSRRPCLAETSACRRRNSRASSVAPVAFSAVWAASGSAASGMERLHAGELGGFGRCQEKRRGGGELLRRVVLAAEPEERFAPLQMQAAPFGGVAGGFFEFQDREVGAVLGDQCLGPHL